MMDEFQKLEDLILEHTTLEARSKLRNQLAIVFKRVEPYQESSDRQDQTLAEQAKEIEQLREENKRLVSELGQALTAV